MSFTLKYFNGRGVAEITRVLFAVAKVSYVDHRFPIDFSTYSRPEFDEAKAAGLFDINMGRLPILEYSGPEGTITLGQSKTIERFIAKKLGLFGSNDFEAAQIDMVSEHVRDIKQKYNDIKSGKKDAELQAAKEKFMKEELPVWFEKLEKSLSGINGFAIGSSVSLADVSIFNIVRDYFDDLPTASAATANAPKLATSAETVSLIAADWLSSRPSTPF